MQKAQLIVENTFIDSGRNNREIGLTVFDRVFNKLVNEGKALGKIHPIYIKKGNIIKTLGALTFNISGSYSFFLELPGEVLFDHMTFNKDLLKDSHHYTRTLGSKREKVLPINTQYLTNEMYYGATFILGEYGLLLNAPKEIIYPEVDINHISELKESFITSGKPEGSTILEIEDNSGVVCMQIFLIPKETDYKKMLPFISPFKSIQSDFELKDGTKLKNLIIPHEYQNEYVLGFVAFLYKENINNSLQILTSAKKQGFYTKLNIDKINKH